MKRTVAIGIAGVIVSASVAWAQCNLKRTWVFTEATECGGYGTSCADINYAPPCERCAAINISENTDCTNG